MYTIRIIHDIYISVYFGSVYMYMYMYIMLTIVVHIYYISLINM